MLGESGRMGNSVLVSSLLGLIPTLQRLRPHVVLSSSQARSVALRIYTAARGSDLLIPEEA